MGYISGDAGNTVLNNVGFIVSVVVVIIASSFEIHCIWKAVRSRLTKYDEEAYDITLGEEYIMVVYLAEVLGYAISTGLVPKYHPSFTNTNK